MKSDIQHLTFCSYENMELTNLKAILKFHLRFKPNPDLHTKPLLYPKQKKAENALTDTRVLYHYNKHAQMQPSV